MTDPIRLLHGEGDDLEVSLLRAGAEEIPSAKARRRVLVAVGVGSAGAATAAATNAGAAAAATQASSLTAAGLPAAWTVTAGAMVKWVGIAVVGAAAAWGLSESASPPPAPPVVASWGASGERIAARAAEGVQQGEQRVPPGDESVAARGSERPAREPRDGPRPEAASTEAGPAKIGRAHV